MKLLLYTDPGSGMMLLQIILAFGASAVFYFRKSFARLIGRKTAIDEFHGSEPALDDRHLKEK